MGEMLEHLWAWLDISAGVWLFPGQNLSSDLVFGVVMWGGGGSLFPLGPGTRQGWDAGKENQRVKTQPFLFPL